MTKIIIKDSRNEVVLQTTNETYKEDLKNNIDKLDIWWVCNVEYDDGKVGYSDYTCRRKVITVNGRSIYADYNLQLEGKQNVYNYLLEFFNEDFETTIQPKQLQIEHQKYKKYLRETSVPKNKYISPIKNNLREDLKDD